MRYLKQDAVLRLHQNLKRDLPVVEGKINHGKIDLILEKLSLKPYGSKEKYHTIYKKAACLFEGFCRGHAFPDGNKRTALLTTFAFLQANEHYLVIPLNVVEYLVKVARDERKTEEEIDALINEIAEWLEERTATNNTEFVHLSKKLVQNPLLKLLVIACTGIGLLYVHHVLNKWFATKYHPEYKQQMGSIMKFLTSTLRDNEKALQNVSA